jgi:hypothetical protein
MGQPDAALDSRETPLRAPAREARIAEIYMKGGKDSLRLARKMFEAASEGRVLCAVTESGAALDPDLDLTSTKDVVAWFKRTKWDTSKGLPIPE